MVLLREQFGTQGGNPDGTVEGRSMRTVDNYRRWADAKLDNAEAAKTSTRTRKYPAGTGQAATGAVLLVLAAIGYFQGGAVLGGTLSVSQYRGLCGSAAGSVAQTLSANAMTACAHVAAATDVLTGMALAGAILLTLGCILLSVGNAREAAHE